MAVAPRLATYKAVCANFLLRVSKYVNFADNSIKVFRQIFHASTLCCWSFTGSPQSWTLLLIIIDDPIASHKSAIMGNKIWQSLDFVYAIGMFFFHLWPFITSLEKKNLFYAKISNFTIEIILYHMSTLLGK